MFELVAKTPLVKFKVPFTVGLPLKLKPPELFNCKFCNVAPLIVAPLPVILNFPVPLCVEVPVIFPVIVTVLPASAKVPPVKANDEKVGFKLAANVYMPLETVTVPIPPVVPCNSIPEVPGPLMFMFTL